MSLFDTYTITESGLPCTIKYTKKSIQKTFIPLVKMIVEDFRKKENERYILCIAGPPGSGKSSIAHLLQLFCGDRGLDAHVLPLDGFHLKNSELKKKTALIDGGKIFLYDVKGAKETYDTAKLFDCMKKLSRGSSFFWPVYSRTTHDPVEKGEHIWDNHSLYIIEGNYLLLSEPPWVLLRPYFDKRIFIESRERILRPRIIGRKAKGGILRREARRHYRKSDRRNIREVLERSGGYDWHLAQQSRYRYSFIH